MSDMKQGWKQRKPTFVINIYIIIKHLDGSERTPAQLHAVAHVADRKVKMR